MLQRGFESLELQSAQFINAGFFDWLEGQWGGVAHL
jgi:hypothetical protein